MCQADVGLHEGFEPACHALPECWSPGRSFGDNSALEVSSWTLLPGLLAWWPVQFRRLEEAVAVIPK